MLGVQEDVMSLPSAYFQIGAGLNRVMIGWYVIPARWEEFKILEAIILENYIL